MKGICVEVLFCLSFFVKAFHLYQLQRDVFSFSCVMSASSKRSEWQRSMALFEDMLQLSIPRNVTGLSLIVAWETNKINNFTSQMRRSMGWGYLHSTKPFPLWICCHFAPFHVKCIWELCFNNRQNPKRIHVGNIYFHLPLKKAIFHLM